jgi:excisionase family DNA binding protein
MASTARSLYSCPGVRAAAQLSLLLIITTSTASAQPSSPCKRAVLTLTEAATLLRIDSEELRHLAEQQAVPSRRIGSSWRFNCAALMAWLNGNWNPPARNAEKTPTAPVSSATDDAAPLLPKDLAGVHGTGAAMHQAQTTPSGGGEAAADSQEPSLGEAPEQRAAEEVFLRGQRVLLGRGEVVLDFGQFYARSDDHLLAFSGGIFGLSTVEQQTYTTLLVGRVGIFQETELFAGATFFSQRTRQFIGSDELATERQDQFGGANVGVRRTLLRENVRRPDIVATFYGYIPPAGTSRAVGAGLVFVKSVDPVILFAGVNYVRALGRVSSDTTRIMLWPEETFDVSLGYGVALNDTLAISMAASGVFTGSSSLDAARPRQPGVISGRLGLTSWLAKGLYIEPSVSFALTGPGNSVAFGVTMPYAF